MVWIIPQSLTSVCAPATAESTSDCVAASLASERLLTRRSKPSPAKSYLREWKAGRLMRLRSGLMSGLSRGNNFATAWISSLEAIRASRSPQPASASDKKTRVTSGPASQEEFPFSDRGSAFSRTSRDTSAWGCEKSSTTWTALVTRRRSEYLARRNLARATSASVYSSLPTPCANEDSFRLKGSSQQSKTLEARARRGELKTAGYAIDVDRISLTAANATIENLNVLPAPSGHIHSFTSQRTDALNADSLSPAGQITQAGPLNPAFVEVMMGLPIGWTDCACSETASSPRSPSEPS